YQRIGNRQRGAGQVPGAQVQKPAHAVQPGDGQGRGTGLFQLGTDLGDLLGGGGTGLGRGQQLTRGVRQGGTCTGSLPQGIGHVQALQGGAVLFQHVGILVGQVGRYAAAVQQQGL